MTVINHRPSSSGRQAVRELKNNIFGIVFIINATMLLIAGFLAVYYVVQANVIAASNYKISILNQKLESLNEVRSSLAVQKSAMEDPAKVLDFALSQNMVEAKNAVYLFENGEVALRR